MKKDKEEKKKLIGHRTIDYGAAEFIRKRNWAINQDFKRRLVLEKLGHTFDDQPKEIFK